jgi:hypothetical protein
MGAPTYGDGWLLDGPANDVVAMPAAAVSIAKGDLLIDNGSGYVTNAGISTFGATALATFVAIEPCDNSGGSAGDLDVLCVSAHNPLNRFWVKNEGTVLTQSEVGVLTDANSEDGLKGCTAVTNTSLGFLIEEIDISTAALAASSSKGFARGRIITLGETT